MLGTIVDESLRILARRGRNPNVARGGLRLQCRPDPQPDGPRPGRGSRRSRVSRTLPYRLHLRGPLSTNFPPTRGAGRP